MPPEGESPPGSTSKVIDSSSGDPGTTASADNPVSVDPWRKLNAKQLRERTVVFKAEKGVQTPRCLESQEISCSQILSVQVSSSGQCRITFSETSVAQQISVHGFVLGSHLVRPSLAGQSNTVQVHIHDVPIWITDGVVTSALSAYGSVKGSIRHGRVQIREGHHIASGVRFATFALAPGKSIPSYVRSADGRGVFRVFYTGQPSTCRICDLPGHMAKDCQKRDCDKRGVTEYSNQNSTNVQLRDAEQLADACTSSSNTESTQANHEANSNNDHPSVDGDSSDSDSNTADNDDDDYDDGEQHQDSTHNSDNEASQQAVLLLTTVTTPAERLVQATTASDNSNKTGSGDDDGFTEYCP